MIRASCVKKGTVPSSDSEDDLISYKYIGRNQTKRYSLNKRNTQSKKESNASPVKPGIVFSSSDESEVELIISPPKRTILKPGTIKSSDSESESETTSKTSKTVVRQGIVESSECSDTEQKKIANTVVPNIDKRDSNPDSSSGIPTSNISIQKPGAEHQESNAKTHDKDNENSTSFTLKPPPKEKRSVVNERKDNSNDIDQERKDNASQVLQHDRLTFTCNFCRSEYNEKDSYCECDNKFSKYGKTKTHKICRECLSRTVSLHTVDLGGKGKGIKCPKDDCDNFLVMNGIQNFIRERFGTSLLADSDIPNFYRCPHCTCAVIVDDTKPDYTCPKCEQRSCKNYDKEYTEDQVNKTYQELTEEEQKSKDESEEKTDILEEVHHCYSCDLPFIKDEGSNKVNCICGATQCYVCGATDIEYNHFGNGKPCPLFTDNKSM